MTETDQVIMRLFAPFDWLKIEKDPLIKDNKAYFANFDQSGLISDYKFTVLDTELTGLDYKTDEIVSIGAVKIENLRIIVEKSFHVYVKPKKPLPKNSTLIHRITPQEIENAPMLETILPDFIRYCNKTLLVGHYIGLDMHFLNRAAKNILGGKLNNPCIDTMRLAQVYNEDQWGNYYDQFNYKISYNLDDLSKEYGLPLFQRHDALQDSLQTAYLFLFLVKKLHQGGLKTLKDLYMAGRSWRWLF